LKKQKGWKGRPAKEEDPKLDEKLNQAGSVWQDSKELNQVVECTTRT